MFSLNIEYCAFYRTLFSHQIFWSCIPHSFDIWGILFLEIKYFFFLFSQVHLERDVCYVMTDFLSRFCIVGQTAAPPSIGIPPNTSCPSACPASKVLRLIVFGKPVSTSLDFSLVIQVSILSTFSTRILYKSNLRSFSLVIQSCSFGAKAARKILMKLNTIVN